MPLHTCMLFFLLQNTKYNILKNIIYFFHYLDKIYIFFQNNFRKKESGLERYKGDKEIYLVLKSTFE